MTTSELPRLPEPLLAFRDLFREHARACRRIVEASEQERAEGREGVGDGIGSGGADAPDDAPWIRRLPPPTLELDPSRVRGDEPELEGDGLRTPRPGSSS